jgi:hypothetical protein
MGIRATVNSVPKNRVSINNNQREIVRTVGLGQGGPGATRLQDLSDVNASSSDNNETLVYDEASGKYVIKELPIVNGGSF